MKSTRRMVPLNNGTEHRVFLEAPSTVPDCLKQWGADLPAVEDHGVAVRQRPQPWKRADWNCTIVMLGQVPGEVQGGRIEQPK